MKILVSLMAFFYLSTVFAQTRTNANNIDQQITTFQTRMKELQADMDKNSSGKKNWETQLARLRTSLENCQRDGTCAGSSKMAAGIEDDIRKAEDQIKRWQADYDSSQKAWSSAKGQLDTLQAQAAKDRVAAVDRVYDGVRDRLVNERLSLMDVKYETATLGRELDKHAIGQYVAAKMGLMLNSQAFCNAKMRCEEPKGTASDANKVDGNKLKEIFPDLNAAVFNNVDLWKEARINRGAEARATPAPARPGAAR
jgi:hypothetical protein